MFIITFFLRLPLRHRAGFVILGKRHRKEAAMKEAHNGDTVKVHYTGKLEDGTVFDSSEERGPLSFTLGQKQLIPGFEQAVLGMSEGESKTVTVPPQEAYGARREDLVLKVEKEKFPPQITPEEGKVLSLRQQDGGVIEAAIVDVGDDTVTLDANHPLAGRDLTFEIELVEVA
jgi:peptidylprolyl isomerase